MAPNRFRMTLLGGPTHVGIHSTHVAALFAITTETSSQNYNINFFYDALRNYHNKTTFYVYFCETWVNMSDDQP